MQKFQTKTERTFSIAPWNSDTNSILLGITEPRSTVLTALIDTDTAREIRDYLSTIVDSVEWEPGTVLQSIQYPQNGQYWVIINESLVKYFWDGQYLSEITFPNHDDTLMDMFPRSLYRAV